MNILQMIIVGGEEVGADAVQIIRVADGSKLICKISELLEPGVMAGLSL
jgi:hypothetical protein